MRAMRMARRGAVRRRGATAPRVNPDPVTAYGGSVQGLWTGGTEPDGVVVSAKLSAASSLVRLVVSLNSDLSNPYYSTDAVATSSATNNGGTTYHLAKPKIIGLPANTQFHYGLSVNGNLHSTLKGEFKTVPAAGSAASFRFVFSSCDLSHTATTYSVMSALSPKPLFYQCMGDMGYFDISSNSQPLFHTNFDSMLSSATMHSFLRTMPTRYTWSDHDFGFDNQKGTAAAARPAALAVYRQRVPHTALALPLSDDPICFEYTVGRVCFLILDCRTDSTAGNAVEGDTGQTRLGPEQKAWFKARIQAPENAGKVFVLGSEVPWVSTSADTDTWSGFRVERHEIADFLKEQGMAGRVCLISGDMHSVAYANGTVTDYATGGGMAIPCLAAAPIDAVSEAKGGPWDQIYTLTGQTANMYGLVDVTDNGGNTIDFAFKGMDAGGTQRVAATFSLSTTLAAPVITIGQTFTVSDAATVGATVGTVAKTGGTVTAWSISGGNTGTAFAISATGVITVASTLNNATTPSYSLSVAASNNGGTDTETVTVNVLSASAFAPLQTKVVSEGANATLTTSVVLTAPATAGSLLLAYITADKSVTAFTAPTGFTLVPSMSHVAGAGVSAALFYKVATGGEQSITCAYTSGTVRLLSAAVVEISGAATTSPIDLSVLVPGNTVPNANPRTLTYSTGASTTAAADELAVAFWSNDSVDTPATATAWGWNNGFTNLADYGFTTKAAGIFSPGLAVGTASIASAGTAVTTTFSYTDGVDDEKVGILVTVRKA